MKLKSLKYKVINWQNPVDRLSPATSDLSNKLAAQFNHAEKKTKNYFSAKESFKVKNVSLNKVKRD